MFLRSEWHSCYTQMWIATFPANNGQLYNRSVSLIIYLLQDWYWEVFCGLNQQIQSCLFHLPWAREQQITTHCVASAPSDTACANHIGGGLVWFFLLEGGWGTGSLGLFWFGFFAPVPFLFLFSYLGNQYETINYRIRCCIEFYDIQNIKNITQKHSKFPEFGYFIWNSH